MNESALLECQREERLRMDQIEKEVCTDPMVNRLIERYGFLYLMAVLREQKAYEMEFPGSELTAEDRSALADAVRAHFADCRRCQLVAENHEWADQLLDDLPRIAMPAPGRP
jgi:hypothetical protein